jgi:hypothetical protein
LNSEAFAVTELPTLAGRGRKEILKQVDFEGVIAKKPKLDHLVLHQVLEPAM